MIAPVSSAASDRSEPPARDRVLELSDLSVNFGGTVALHDVSFGVEASERVGLIGPNGAGKTTLLAAVSGILRPSAGRVYRRGVDVTQHSAEARARAGIGRTFQQSSRLSALTAAESVAVAILAQRTDRPFVRGVFRRGNQLVVDALARSRDLLDELDIGQFSNVPSGDLPLGISRLVDAARAIAGEPELLLLDEPSSGLDGTEREQISAFLRHHVAQRGTAFVLVEHDVEFVRSLCDRIVVLDFGEKIADGPTASVLADDAVRAAYLGEETDVARVDRELAASVATLSRSGGPVTDANPADGGATDGVAIELRHVTAGYGRSPAITDVSLRVLRGTTVAVLGPNGSGKTTLARVMTGGLMPSAGQIVLDGTDATGRATARVARMGVFHVPDDRAIYPSLTVRENLRMALRFAVPRRQVGAEIDRVFELLPSLRLRATTRAGLLSGGEQQMLAIARAIAAPPAILVVDELSHGLAPLVVAEMFEILRRLKERVTLVVIEQFTERALAIADTVVVLRRGAVIHTGPVGGVTDDDLVAWYDLGGTEPFAATPADPSKNPSRTPATPSEARRP